MEIYACIIGRSVRASWLLKHLSHDSEKLELIYPFWVLRDGDSVTLIDTGFDAEPAAARNVDDHRNPASLLSDLGIKPDGVNRVIVSHLHWDHFCNPERYPNAVFLIQKADLEYFQGYGVNHAASTIADGPSLQYLRGLQREGRVELLDGDTAVAKGLRTYLVGGHTPGMQVTVVEASGEPVVFACDASHLYWNLENRIPTSIINDYSAYVAGFEKIDALRGGGLWFPGHDPRIVEHLQPVSADIFQLVR